MKNILKYLPAIILAIGFCLFSQNALASSVVQERSYLAVVKIITYYEDEYYNLVPLKSGSGVIISEDGLVLTNDHVVSVRDDFDQEMPTAYIICLTEDFTEAPDCSLSAELLTTNKDTDLALLKLVTKDFTSKTEFDYMPLADSNSYRGGDSVLTIGYPASGGETVTYDFGEVAGAESINGVPWIKTDALVSFGSSGGALVDISGNLIGITTAKNDDLGYALDIAYFKNWINDNSGKAGQTSTLFERLKMMLQKHKRLKSMSDYNGVMDIDKKFENDKPAFELIEPNNWTFEYLQENKIFTYEEDNVDSGFIAIEWLPLEVNIDEEVIDAIVKTYEINNNCFVSGTETLGILNLPAERKTGTKLTCPMEDQELHQVLVSEGNYLIIISYYLGTNNNAIYLISDSFKTMYFKGSQSFEEKKYFKHTNPFFELTLDEDWRLMQYNKSSTPVVGGNKSDYKKSLSMYVEKLTETQKTISNESYFNFIKDSEITRKDMEERTDLKGVRYAYSTDYWINDQLPHGIFYKYKYIDEEDGNQPKVYSAVYRFRNKENALILEFSHLTESETEFNEALKEFESNVLPGLNLGLDSSGVVKPNESSLTEVENDLSNSESEINNDNSPAETFDLSLMSDEKREVKKIGKKLTGKIILQVEKRGEAWYISPSTGQAHYLANGAAAYQLMREQGLGITNVDLNKIPVGLSNISGDDTDGDGLVDPLEQALGTDINKADTDNDGRNDKEEMLGGYDPLKAGVRSVYNNVLTNKQKGRILLQVEGRGEAWYVNPADGKRYFLGRAEDAYQIMREKGLGISEQDFANL